MSTSKLHRLHDEVMHLTVPPDLAVVERRAVRRRVRRRVVSTLGVAVLLTGVLLRGALPSAVQRDVVATPSARPTSTPGARVAWVGVGDEAHLYTLLNPTCGGCPSQLAGSDDGGRSWTERQVNWFPEVGEPQVRGTRTLFVPAVLDKQLQPVEPPRLSTDGGRTWTELTVSDAPAVRIPDGGWLDAGGGMAPQVQTLHLPGATLHVVDPVTRTVRPFAGLPAGIAPAGVAVVPTGAGLWIAGTDQDGEPSVSVSRDGGATWATHSFAGVTTVPTVTATAAFLPTMHVSTHDGRIVNVLIGDESGSYGFRSTDGGQTWTRTGGGLPLPVNMDSGGNPALTLPDGTHVLQQPVDDGDPAIRLLFGRGSGQKYQPDERVGPLRRPARVALDGSYLVDDGQVILRSADGRNWRTIDPPR